MVGMEPQGVVIMRHGCRMQKLFPVAVLVSEK